MSGNGTCTTSDLINVTFHHWCKINLISLHIWNLEIWLTVVWGWSETHRQPISRGVCTNHTVFTSTQLQHLWFLLYSNHCNCYIAPHLPASISQLSKEMISFNDHLGLGHKTLRISSISLFHTNSLYNTESKMQRGVQGLSS